MVDVVITGVSGRATMAQALRGFAGLQGEVGDQLSRNAAPEINAAAS
jgi:hypothetical protein